MNVLFNETFKDKVTIWVDTNYTSLDDLELGCEDLVDVIAREDLMLDTYFIFYTKMLSTDAIEDKVRTSVYVKCTNFGFEVNFNVSDYQFVCNNDQLIAIKNKLNTVISSRLYNK